MRIPRIAQYVNQMRNLGYVTGFARHINKIKKDTWHKHVLPDGWHGVLVQQNNNLEQALPIQIPMDVPLPADKEPVTIAVHAFGNIDPRINEPTLTLESIDIARPSVRAMPTSLIWSVSANDKFADDDFNPFGRDGALIKEIKEKLDQDEFNNTELILQTMLMANKGRLDTRFGGNTNVMIVAGFLEAASAFNPTADSFQQNPYWSLLIRQHKNKKACLPVRLYTPNTRSFKDKLRRAAPYMVVGQLRVKVFPNEDGTVKGAIVYIRTDDIHGATRTRDILDVPDWYSDLRIEIQREIEERKRSLLEAASKAQTSIEDALFGEQGAVA